MDKKLLPSKIFSIMSKLLIGVFIFTVASDGYKYSTDPVYMYGSAPFSLYVIVRAMSFLAPAIICFLLERLMRKKGK